MIEGDAKTLAANAFRRGFSGIIRIIPDDGAAFDIDGRGDACSISDNAQDGAPDCVWRASSETLTRIFEGGRALESAYLSGRLRIAGDMSVMARLLLESSR